jgi:hypothetical protein
MIKNGDLPAMPAITLSEVESNSGLKYELKTECVGLTKREQFAMAAMQGIMANASGGYSSFEYLSQDAVAVADALLAELEKSK